MLTTAFCTAERCTRILEAIKTSRRQKSASYGPETVVLPLPIFTDSDLTLTPWVKQKMGHEP